MYTGSRLFADPGLLARAIADATDDVIFAKDLEGRYQFANPATLRVLGLRIEEVFGRTDLEVMRDASAAQAVMAADQRVFATGDVVEAEETVPLPDGTTRHWLTRKMPLRDDSGRVVGLLGIGRDITQRKLAEQQMEANRLKLQMGIQAAGLVMAEIDYQTNENHISAELARLLQLGEGDCIVPRQAIFDRIHPLDRQRYLDGIAQSLDPYGSGHLAIDVRALLPDGEVKWLHIRLQVTFTEVDGMLVPDKGICAAREVTAERAAERKLQEAQRLTQAVIDGAGALVYAKDLRGRYILWNQAWLSLQGLDDQQAQDVTDEVLFGPALAAELRANDEAVLRSGEPRVVQEVLQRGTHRMVFRSSKFPLVDDAGQVYAVCGVSTDITDVVEADRRKDEFVATLAHELRNPLAPIRTGLEILRRVGELPPMAARTRDMMERQLRHMVRLVDDLLDVSRINRDKLELRLERLSLDRVVEHGLEASHPAVLAAGHQLEVDIVEPVPRVTGDLTRLAQVVSNLVNNAAKYTPTGGRITVQVRKEGDEGVIRVTDTGNGISAQELSHVFDMFAQAHRTTPGPQGGLGIGLWLVRKLVELHRGQIEAASPGPGRGSTFTVRLPLSLPTGLT